MFGLVKGSTIMGFNRRFDDMKIFKDDLLFKLLYSDIKQGIVFPAVRDNTMDFYYGGGVLFHFSGKTFKRDRTFEKYDPAYMGDTGLSTNKTPAGEHTYGRDFIQSYDSFKKQNQNRFKSNNSNESQERQYLEKYYKETYSGSVFPPVCVLDIEVRINEDGSARKCDMALYNSIKNMIMFVEGKLFSNGEVTCKSGSCPKVISQVKRYAELIAVSDMRVKEVEKQYQNYLSIVSELFGMQWTDEPPKLIKSAKLLIFETPPESEMTKNQKNSVAAIDQTVRAMWVRKRDDKTLAEIWEYLSN
jgi:hypothetical protein